MIKIQIASIFNLILWWVGMESNHLHRALQARALPVELPTHEATLGMWLVRISMSRIVITTTAVTPTNTHVRMSVSVTIGSRYVFNIIKFQFFRTRGFINLAHWTQSFQQVAFGQPTAHPFTLLFAIEPGCPCGVRTHDLLINSQLLSLPSSRAM